LFTLQSHQQIGEHWSRQTHDSKAENQQGHKRLKGISKENELSQTQGTVCVALS
jgi:hypothetical protein